MTLTHVEGAILASRPSSASSGPSDLVRAVSALRCCVARVRVVVPPGVHAPIDLPRILAEAGAPLAGLHAALRACESAAVLVASADAAANDPARLLALLALVPAEGGWDAVVTGSPDSPRPLPGVYRPRILPEVARRSEGALEALLPSIDALYLPESALPASSSR